MRKWSVQFFDRDGNPLFFGAEGETYVSAIQDAARFVPEGFDVVRFDARVAPPLLSDKGSAE